jgi:hypothetical protein
VLTSRSRPRTEVAFNFSFELRALPSIGEAFVARRLERTMNARLAGLKTTAESGAYG